MRLAQRAGRFAVWAMVGLSVQFLIVYLVDVAIYTYRARHNQAVDHVTVTQMTSVALKANKEAYYPDGEADVPCARALFPHDGDRPCWYLRRHREVIVSY